MIHVKDILYLGLIPRIFEVFCAQIFYFWRIHMKAQSKLSSKMLNFFEYLLNIGDFSTFVQQSCA